MADPSKRLVLAVTYPDLEEYKVDWKVLLTGFFKMHQLSRALHCKG